MGCPPPQSLCSRQASKSQSEQTEFLTLSCESSLTIRFCTLSIYVFLLATFTPCIKSFIKHAQTLSWSLKVSMEEMVCLSFFENIDLICRGFSSEIEMLILRYLKGSCYAFVLTLTLGVHYQLCFDPS